MKLYILMFVASVAAFNTLGTEYTDNYKNAYSAIKEGNCTLAVPLLNNELKLNKKLTKEFRFAIDKQIFACENIMLKKLVRKISKEISEGSAIMQQPIHRSNHQ